MQTDIYTRRARVCANRWQPVCVCIFLRAARSVFGAAESACRERFVSSSTSSLRMQSHSPNLEVCGLIRSASATDDTIVPNCRSYSTLHRPSQARRALPHRLLLMEWWMSTNSRLCFVEGETHHSLLRTITTAKWKSRLLLPNWFLYHFFAIPRCTLGIDLPMNLFLRQHSA
jgi:hypothetical protein